jgi:adenylate cyclase, class 2
MIEAEVKARSNHKKLLELLERNGAKYAGSQTMIDAYYSLKPDEDLRIRRSDKGVFITFKGPKIIGKSRKEINLQVHDGKDADKLLNALGHQRICVIKKKRVEYEIDDASVSLDTVEGLGDFAEIEIMTPEDRLSSTLDKINKIAKKLDVGPFIDQSYPELLQCIKQL